MIRLITVVGGEPDALVVAFDKRTARRSGVPCKWSVRWAYGQPVIYEAGGARQLIVWHATALVSLDPDTGDVYWNQEWAAGSGLSVATPSGAVLTCWYRSSITVR